MKSINKILIIIFSLLLLRCEGIINVDDPSIPIDPPIALYHGGQKRSLLGDKIAFISGMNRGILKILNLKNNTIKNISIQDKLPTNMFLIGLDKVYWSSYDNNKLLIHLITSTDTVGNGKRYHYGQHLCILSLDNFDLEIITPKVLGSIGAAGMNIYSWLPESNADKDFIQISFSRDRYSSYKITGQFIYIPQKDTLLNVKVKNILDFTKKETSFNPWFYYSFSIDYSNYYETIYSIDEYYYYSFDIINRYKCKFSKQFLLTKASWSPNGKYLALSVTNIEDGPSAAIWLIDLEKFINEKPYILQPKQINFFNHKSLRFYSEVFAEFITDSTLAVTLKKNDEDFAFLWEISIDGKIVRQLTFNP